MEEGEAAVRSDGFFLHNGGAKRPQAVGLWGVFSSSARDVLPCKCVFCSFAITTADTNERGRSERQTDRQIGRATKSERASEGE